MKTRHVIYCYTNKINRKSYVGQALCKPGVEPMRAVVMRRKGGYESCRIFFNALNKYGLVSFRIKVLEVIVSRAKANRAEVAWISKLKSQKPYGYNLEPGGGALPRHPDTIRRMKEVYAERGPKWLSERAKKASAATSPEKRRENALKASKAAAKASPEERSRRARERVAQTTPERYKAIAKKIHAGFTHEDYVVRGKKAAASRTKKTKEAGKQKMRDYWASLSPEARAERMRKVRESLTHEVRSRAGRTLAKSRGRKFYVRLAKKMNASMTPEKLSARARTRIKRLGPKRVKEIMAKASQAKKKKGK